MTHYAHSLRTKPHKDWHELDKHLSDTACLAEHFAAGFGPGWGYLAGLWHDLGKYQVAFQRRIDQDANAHIELPKSSLEGQEKKRSVISELKTPLN